MRDKTRLRVDAVNHAVEVGDIKQPLLNDRCGDGSAAS
jgi:hypothetical protein